jgi:hypothetical protein
LHDLADVLMGSITLQAACVWWQAVQQTGTLWGDFPQTYSRAGLILSAMRLSRSWQDRHWRW